ncbi:MAG: hypothetical protein NTY48_05470 [Candidatus Diapherotrites archaeon]|nr:hypothetical protein [Candidatus Diapherotrites archaeon]
MIFKAVKTVQKYLFSKKALLSKKAGRGGLNYSPPAKWLRNPFKLKKAFFFMENETKLYPENISYSWKDKKKGLILPKLLSKDLAYLAGVHIGDGCMNIYRRRHQVDYYYGIYGHYLDDKELHETVLVPLFSNLFNLKPTIRMNCVGCCSVTFRSKAVVSFYNQCLQMPLGKKSAIIDIPKVILDSGLNYILPCVSGIFDTDFSLSYKKKTYASHQYPIIRLSVNSKKLVETISRILNEIGITNFICERRFFDKRFDSESHQYSVSVSGKKNLDLWFEKIGSRNPSRFSRYKIWKKFGYCPPKTSYLQRKQILCGELNPGSFYNK